MTTQRMIRVLVYEGTPEWISTTHAHRAVKGSFVTANGFIKEAIIGDFLEEVKDRAISPNSASRVGTQRFSTLQAAIEACKEGDVIVLTREPQNV